MAFGKPFFLGFFFLSKSRNYRSLAEFFTRSLRDDVRVIDSRSSIVAPCDGRVLHFGSATNEQIEQVSKVFYVRVVILHVIRVNCTVFKQGSNLEKCIFDSNFQNNYILHCSTVLGKLPYCFSIFKCKVNFLNCPLIWFPYLINFARGKVDTLKV